MKKEECRIGQVVKYTAKFLRNTGQYTGSPKNGKITGFSDGPWVKVIWCNRNEEVCVHPNNIMLDAKPDYTNI